MILPITNRNTRLNFSSDNQKDKNEENKLPYTHDTVLKNTFSNRMRIGVDKLTNALHGFSYEFLNAVYTSDI